jgi:hypothetical protein
MAGIKVLNYCNDGQSGITLDGIYIEKSEYRNMPKSRTILQDLSKIPVPENIKKRANEIFMESDIPTRRTTKRKLLVYHCLSCAYQDLNIVFTPERLAKDVGISENKIKAASTNYAKYTMQYCNKNPTDVSDYIYKHFMMSCLQDSIYPNVIKMKDIVLKNNEDLSDCKPQHLSAAIITSFCYFHNITLDSSFYNGINIKKSSIKRLCDVVIDTYSTSV